MIGPGFLKALDQLRVGGLAKGRNLYGPRVSPGGLGQLVQDCPTPLELLRAPSRRHPAVTPGNHSLEDILRRFPQDYRWVRLLRWLGVAFDCREVVVLAMELGFLFSPELLHHQDRLSGLRPPMFKVAAHYLRLLPQPAGTDAEDDPAAGEQVQSSDRLGQHQRVALGGQADA